MASPVLSCVRRPELGRVNDAGVRLAAEPRIVCRRRFKPSSCEPANCLLRFRQTDGCGAGAFAALADGIFDGLPLTKFFEGNPLNFRVMKEQVVPLTFHKPETTIRHEPLDLTLWHLCPPEKTSSVYSSRHFVTPEL